MPKWLSRSLCNLLAWIASLLVMIPFVVMLVNSFKTRDESYSMTLRLPAVWRWGNYGTVLDEGQIIPSFWNSLLYSAFSVAIVVVVCAMAAFVISRRYSGFNRVAYFGIIMGIVMPVNYVALMQVMHWTGLNNTRGGMVLLYAAMNIPISLFILSGFIDSLPRDLDEAAVLDGCGPWRLFFGVIFPLLKPVLITVGVLCFMASWNDFMMPLYYLNQSDKWPMSLTVYNFFGNSMQAGRKWNLVCADIVLTSLPVILVYLLGQKYIVSGVTTGAVKG